MPVYTKDIDQEKLSLTLKTGNEMKNFTADEEMYFLHSLLISDTDFHQRIIPFIVISEAGVIADEWLHGYDIKDYNKYKSLFDTYVTSN